MSYLTQTVRMIGGIFGILIAITTLWRTIYSFFKRIDTLQKTIENIRDNHLHELKKDIRHNRTEIKTLEDKVDENTSQIDNIRGYLKGQTRNG